MYLHIYVHIMLMIIFFTPVCSQKYFWKPQTYIMAFPPSVFNIINIFDKVYSLIIVRAYKFVCDTV